MADSEYVPGMMQIPYTDHFPGRITSMCKLDTVVKVIEGKLTKRQLQLFKKDIFGHFLECRTFPFSGVIMHNLLLDKWPVMREISYGLKLVSI